MELIVNGQAENCPPGLSVTELLHMQKVKMPDMVSVELNGKILRREEFPATILQQNDRVEFLYFMGGGRDTY